MFFMMKKKIAGKTPDCNSNQQNCSTVQSKSDYECGIPK